MSKTMIIVVGMWELGWNTPIKEVDLWEMVIRDLGADLFYMTPVSGIASPIVKECATVEEVLNLHPDLPVIIVDELGEEKLNTFKHPESCIYLFGKTTCSALNMGSFKRRTLMIETVRNDSLLWAHQACAIVLYDRLRKSWQ
jgi:hypothetical protein